MQEALDDQVVQCRNLKGELATVQGSLERAETDVQRLRTEASTRSTNYTEEASDHQSTRNLLNQLQESFDSLVETCDARRSEVNILERQRGQLRIDLRSARDEVRRLESEADDYKQVIANLEAKVSGLERQKDQLGLDLRSEREEVRQLESEAEGYKKVIANLETKVSGLERQKDQLGLDLQSERDKVQRLESEASDSKKLIASGAAKVSYLQSQINQLNIDLRSERDEVRRLESVVVDEDETVRELQRKLEAQVQETVKVQKTADSQNTEIERLNAAAAQQQKDVQDAITASNVKYEAQTQYLANVQETAERQAAEIERLNTVAAQQQETAQDAIRTSDAKYEAQAQNLANVQETADKQAAEIERLNATAARQQETAQDTLNFVENEKNTLKSTTAQQEKNIEDLRHAKEGAETHSLSISKFFLSYIKAVQGIENLDLSVVGQMMAFSDSTPSSASAPALEVGRVGPRMIMCGRLSRHLSELNLATAYSLWLSAMSGSTDLYGVDNFFGQQNVTSDQSLVSWVVGAVSQTIRNLSSQNALTPKFVKTILLMLQGVAYIHIIGKVLPSQESPSELLELLAVWLDEQPAQIPVNSVIKEALTAVQQLIQSDVPISSWISLVNIDAARILDATNSDLPIGSFLIADDIRGVFIFHQATGEIVIFENDDFTFHIGGVDGIGIDVVFSDGLPTLNLAVPDGGNTGAPLRWMVGYVDESLLR